MAVLEIFTFLTSKQIAFFTNRVIGKKFVLILITDTTANRNYERVFTNLAKLSAFTFSAELFLAGLTCWLIPVQKLVLTFITNAFSIHKNERRITTCFTDVLNWTTLTIFYLALNDFFNYFWTFSTGFVESWRVHAILFVNTNAWLSSFCEIKIFGVFAYFVMDTSNKQNSGCFTILFQDILVDFSLIGCGDNEGFMIGT